MIICKYGIELHRVTHSDIEMIRLARNRDDIRLKMLDQRIITAEQQEKWFHSINNANNFYFIIKHNSQPIGLIHSKNIDWQKREDEGGIFIWDNHYLGTGIPTKASILLMQLCFSIAKLKRTYAHVHPSNQSAYHYNLALGYQLTTKPHLMVLTHHTYQQRIERLRLIASNGKDITPLALSDITLDNKDDPAHYFNNGRPNGVLNNI